MMWYTNKKSIKIGREIFERQMYLQLILLISPGHLNSERSTETTLGWEAELSDEMSVNLQLNCSTDCTQIGIFSLGISEKDDKSDFGISSQNA